MPDVTSDVRFISTLPGESENSTTGGDPLWSALMQGLPANWSISKSVGFSALSVDILEVSGGPLLDNWLTGDMVTENNFPSTYIQANDPYIGKYEEAGDGKYYTIRNDINVSFDRDASGGIDETTVNVTFDGDVTPSVLEQEGINTLKDDLSHTNLEVPGGYRPRYYSTDITTVDGTDAVWVSTALLNPQKAAG